MSQSKIKAESCLSLKRSYLDHAATSPMRPESIEAFNKYASLVGNAAALHGSGRNTRAILEDARESLASNLGAAPNEIIFTSGGSEADSLAILGVNNTKKRRILVSAIEHPAVGDAVKRGIAEEISVSNNGILNLDELSEKIDDTVALVSVMMVNNETGIIQPVAEISKIAHKHGALFHSDAVQGFCRIPINFSTSNIDLMSISAHKVGGPVGIGALVARKEVALRPLGLGGGQERKIRSGTQSVVLATSFAAAVEKAVSELANESARITKFHNRLRKAISQLPNVNFNTKGEYVPQILNVTFDGIRADDLLYLLDRAGIDTSVGSACQAGVHRPSSVLMAMGLTEDAASASLRFSFGWTTSDNDLDKLITVLPESLEKARTAFQFGR